MSTIKLSPLARTGGTISTNFTMKILESNIKVFLFDDRIKAAQVPESIDIGGVAFTTQQIEDEVTRLKDIADQYEEDSLVPLTAGEVKRYGELCKILDKKVAPFRLWGYPKGLPDNTGLACNLKRHTLEDGTKVLKGFLKLCKLMDGKNKGPDGKFIKIHDYSKDILSWNVVVTMEGRMPSELTLTPVKVGEVA